MSTLFSLFLLPPYILSFLSRSTVKSEHLETSCRVPRVFHKGPSQRSARLSNLQYLDPHNLAHILKFHNKVMGVGK